MNENLWEEKACNESDIVQRPEVYRNTQKKVFMQANLCTNDNR